MNGFRRARLARILVGIGLLAMVVGAVDPLEGSLVILPGVAIATLAAFLAGGAQRKLLLWAFLLVAAGVGAMFGVSAVGGFGGRTGRSMWWALVLLPYPVGWILAVVGAIRTLREKRPSPTIP